MLNNYAKAAIIRRQKRKQEQVAKPTVTKNVSDLEPPIYWNPPLGERCYDYINWSDDTTINCSNHVIDKFKTNNHLLLCMPTGTGKTAVAVNTLGEIQKKQNKKLKFAIISTSKIVSGQGWEATINSYNKSHPNNQLEPTILTTIDRFSKICQHKKSRSKVQMEFLQDSFIVLDEVQKYKNPVGKRLKSIVKLKNIKFLTLSATPLTNNRILDSVSYLMLDGQYNSRNDFYNRTNLMPFVGDDGTTLCIFDDDGRVNEVLWPYYPQYLKELARIIYIPSINMKNLYLPSITNHIEIMPFVDELEADVRSLAYARKKRMFDTYKDFEMEVMVRINTDKARLSKLLEIVQDEEVKQPLIFYLNDDVRKAIQKLFDDHKIQYVVINGQEKFNPEDADRNVPFIIQYQAGSEGIEFKNSNTTIFYQNQFSYNSLIQGIGRNVRRGMGGEVNHYYFIADNFFDQQLYEKLQSYIELNNEELSKISNIDDYLEKLNNLKSDMVISEKEREEIMKEYL